MGESVKRYKVLVVEDDPDIMELVNVTLRPDDYQLMAAMDGEEALQKVHAEHPDLVLLDIKLPKKDGLEICQAIKEDPELQRTQVLMLTAFGQKNEIEEGFRSKADAYIVKPFEPPVLRKQVRQYLESSRPA